MKNKKILKTREQYTLEKTMCAFWGFILGVLIAAAFLIGF